MSEYFDDVALAPRNAVNSRCVAGPRMADVAVAALAKFAREEQLEYRVLGREE